MNNMFREARNGVGFMKCCVVGLRLPWGLRLREALAVLSPFEATLSCVHERCDAVIIWLGGVDLSPLE